MSPQVKAALWMIGAIAAFTSMAVAGRAVSLDHDTFEIMLFRSAVGIVLVVLLGAAFGTLGQITRRHLWLHLLRNMSHFMGQNLWFWALPLIPLAHLFALEFTMPIWVAILAAIFLGEALTGRRVLAIGIGFVGVLIVVRPDASALTWGTIAAAVAAIGFAGSAVTTRKLTQTETITCILFWLTVMQFFLGLLFVSYDGAIRWPTWGSLPWLCVIAVAGLTAHFCLTTALSLAQAAFVMPFDFARLPLIAVIGALFYDEVFDLWVVAGAALIFFGNWVNVTVKQKAP